MIPLQFDFFGIFANLPAFLIFTIVIGGMIGIISRKLSIISYGAILTWSYVTLRTDIFIFDAILYLILLIVILWASMFVVGGYLESDPEGV